MCTHLHYMSNKFMIFEGSYQQTKENFCWYYRMYQYHQNLLKTFKHKSKSILNHGIILIQRKVQGVVINFMKTNNMIHHKRQKFQKMIQYPLYYKYNTIRIKQTIVIQCRFSSIQRSAIIHKLYIMKIAIIANYRMIESIWNEKFNDLCDFEYSSYKYIFHGLLNCKMD